MDSYFANKRNHYFVIKFLDLPNQDIGKYPMCVSRDMIREYESSDEKFLVPYPGFKTIAGVLTNQTKTDEEPSLYFSRIVYGAHDYKETEEYIKMHFKSDKYHGDFLINAINAISQPNKVYLKSEDNFHIVQLMELPFPHMKTYCVAPSQWIKRYGPTNEILVAYPPPNYEIDDTGYFDKNNDNSHLWKLHFAKIIFGSTNSRGACEKLKELNDNNQQEMDDGNDDSSNSERNQEVFLTKYNELSKKLDYNIDKINTMFVNMQETVNDLNETKQEMKSVYEEFLRNEEENKSTSSEDKNETSSNDDATDESNDDYIEDEPSPRKKLKRQSGKIILPPEYNVNDPRWTLKHPEHKKGLVELLEGSQVYVDSQIIEKCNEILKIVSKSNFVDVLTNLLLEEIFSTPALAVCSYIVLHPKSSVGDKVRPSIYYNAVLALEDFIYKMGRKKKWFVDVPSLVKKSANNKMRQLRNMNDRMSH